MICFIPMLFSDHKTTKNVLDQGNTLEYELKQERFNICKDCFNKKRNGFYKKPDQVNSRAQIGRHRTLSPFTEKSYVAYEKSESNLRKLREG